MSKQDKLRRKLRNNPKGVRFSDLETLLTRFGFRIARIRGSHHVFEYKQGEVEVIIVVPIHGANVKPFYVKTAIELLDELFPEQEDAEEEADEDNDEDD